MFAEKKAEWVAALRSGEWEQAQEFLRRVGEYDAEQDQTVKYPKPKYCCLGVLCELNNWTWDDTANELLPISIHEDVGGFPTDNECAINLAGALPFRSRDNQLATLAACNDSGCTFPQIADLIEMFY